MSKRVLFVDDEEMLLETFKRMFRRELDMSFASNGKEALATIASEGPFAVIVSDQQMPDMDGIQFLAEARKRCPDAVRVMLTGNADWNVAISAVNDGRIFRFLTKPVDSTALLLTVKACISQHDLVVSERELIEKTLTGSLEVMSEILSLVNPIAFGQTLRVRRCIRVLAEALKLKNVWEFEMAALVSQIGCVTLPTETLQKIYKNTPLSVREHAMYRAHPDVASHLLSKIPRMETVADMVKRQQRAYDGISPDAQGFADQRGVVGGHLLRIAIAFDQRKLRGLSTRKAVEDMASDKASFFPPFVKILSEREAEFSDQEDFEVSFPELEPGQVLGENIHTSTGVLLAAAGTELTETMILRLRAFALSNELERTACRLRGQRTTGANQHQPSAPA